MQFSWHFSCSPAFTLSDVTGTFFISTISSYNSPSSLPLPGVVGFSSSKKLNAAYACPPHALSSVKNAKWPPTTGRALNRASGKPPSPSVRYKSVSGESRYC
jgi:hypothetical protein